MHHLQNLRKKIDYVLDIQDDESDQESDKASVSNEAAEPEGVVTDTESKSNENEWVLDSPEDNLIVVSEPNPVFDAHGHADASIYLNTPNSLSPTDDHLDDRSTTQNAETAEQHHGDLPPAENRTDIFDDVNTVASSDIEILRYDQCSGVSQNMSLTNVYLENMSNLPHDIRDKMVILQSQNEHFSKKIRDMSKVNSNLEASNQSLKKQNKTLTERLSIAHNDKKVLVEKEKEMKELMAEGEKLAATNGKQYSEIKRLRNELKQLDVVTTARDSVLSELQDAHRNIHVLEEVLRETKEQLETQEKNNQDAMKLLLEEKSIAESSKLQGDEYQTSITQFQSKINELQTTIQDLMVEKEKLAELCEEERKSRLIAETELFKKIDDLDGLQEENLSNSRKMNSLSQVNADLRRRLDNMIEKEQEVASQLAEVQNPLLFRIRELEEQVQIVRINDRGLREKVQELDHQKRSFQAQKAALEAELNKLRDASHEFDLKNEKLRFKCNSAKEQFLQVKHELSSNVVNLAALKKQCSVYFEQDNLFLSQMQSHKETVLLMMAKIKELLEKNAKLTNEISNLKNSKPLLARMDSSSSFAHDERMNMSGASFAGYDYFGSTTELSALRDEIQTTNRYYEHTLKKLEQSESDLAEKGKEVLMIQKAMQELQDSYDILLQEYGARIETIEELQLDNSDLRKVINTQAEKIAECCVPFNK